MDSHDLLAGEAVQIATGAFQSSCQVLSGLVLFIGLQCDDVVRLLCYPPAQRLKTGDQSIQPEEKHVRPCFGVAVGEPHEGFDRRPCETVCIIDQQINFLPGNGELDNLRHDRLEVGDRGAHGLSNLLKQRTGIQRPRRSDHHALYRLLVAAGDERLAKQRLAAPLRPGHNKH